MSTNSSLTNHVIAWKNSLNDVEYLACHFLQIRGKKGPVGRFLLNKEQRWILRALEQQQKNDHKIKALILKGRQIGSSTLISALNYHFLLFNPGMRSLVLTHRQSSTNNIYSIMHRFYQRSPDFLKVPASFRKYEELNFLLQDSSCLFATAGGSEVGRSETLQMIHGSEVAFWPNAHEHLASVFMASSLEVGSRIILESTSNGRNNIFYDLCLKASKKLNDFQLIFIPWFWQAEYNTAAPESWEPSGPWREYALAYNLTESQLYWAYLKNEVLCKATGESEESGPSINFRREFPACFEDAFLEQGTGGLIAGEEVAAAAIDVTQARVGASLDKGKYSQFLERQRRSKASPIILGVDIAAGGKDWSWVIDRQGELLGFKVNQKIQLSDTMQVAYWVASHIQSVGADKVFIDAGGMGIAVADRLKELGYGNCVQPVYFAGRAKQPQRFTNKRAEMWFLLKEFLKSGHIVLDPELLRQITSVRAFYNLKGQLQLEDKSKIQGGISPDGADAAALTFAAPLLSAGGHFYSSNADQTSSYNPFEW